jgi:hypothetical protein
MIGQYYKLNHEKAQYGRRQVKVFKLNGQDYRNRQQNVSAKYGTQGKKKGFSFGFADSQGEGLADEDKINDAEDGTQHHSFAHWPEAGQKKT